MAQIRRDSQTLQPLPISNDELSVPSTWFENPPTTLEDRLRVLKARKRHLRDRSREGKELRSLLQQIDQHHRQLQTQAQAEEPFYFLQPSFEQALMLNCWIWGITFPMAFTSNRIGKTAIFIINAFLWCFPNCPNWPMFRSFTDHLGRTYRVHPRPEFRMVRRIQQALKRLPPSLQKPDPRPTPESPHNAPVLQWLQNELPVDTFLSAWPDPPWNRGGTIWFCAPDHKKIQSDFFPELLRWLPRRSILRQSAYDGEIIFKTPRSASDLEDPYSVPKTVWTITAKSFDSNPEKFASGAVDMILITEGAPRPHFKEIKLRFKSPGTGSWDYTPHEAINTGSKSKLAWDVYHGREEVPLKHFVFTKFKVADAPDYIISKDKKADMERVYRKDPEGKARLDGEFYSSSGLVLSHLSRDLHLLPWTRQELFRQFPDARIYRGFDPGLDHPASCAWGALLPTNQFVIYRIMAERHLVISERCALVTRLSHNERVWVPFKNSPNPSANGYFVESHSNPDSEVVVATFADYHVFKTDEQSGAPFALNYAKEGLTLTESTHLLPEQRCELLNDMLEPSPFLPHPITHVPPAPRVFFLHNEPGILSAFLKWEEYFWDRFKSGDKRGEPKDKVPDINDDELDAVCYLTGAPIRWTKRPPRARILSSTAHSSTEPEHHSIHDLPIHPSTQTLQRLQKPQQQQVVYFGELNIEADDHP